MKPASKNERCSPEGNSLHISLEGYTSLPHGIKSQSLRTGLSLSISHPKAGVPLTSSFEVDEAPIQFGFTCFGKNRCTYSGGSFRNHTHEMQSGSNGIFYLPKTRGVLEKPDKDPACVIGILATPEFLRSYFSDSMDQLPLEFQKNVDETRMNPMAWFGKSTPTKRHLLSQILNCPYTGGIRRLFLESRVMELLALQINDYAESKKICQKQATLRPDDVERIRSAKDILVKDLDAPPSLTELAACAGLNEKKLKIGFRQVFGTSVFGFFREHRLQKAHELLRQGNLNVTETAYAIGYQSLSHFSRAFKKRFGILPKDFWASQR
nr:AraC family transcriptional regulator [uncultured Pseudodesulfovibrio sp.]